MGMNTGRMEGEGGGTRAMERERGDGRGVGVMTNLYSPHKCQKIHYRGFSSLAPECYIERKTISEKQWH